MNTPEDALQGWLDDLGVDADTLCRLTAVSPRWLAERVAEGLIDAEGAAPAAWRFRATTLRRVRCMARIERHFDAVPELAALVADLEAEIDRLRARLRRAGL